MAGLAAALTVAARLACGQAVPAEAPPAPAKPQTETDIGRVTTGPGQGENARETVVPSATTTRAAALEQKRQAPNIIEVQPLSEIIKLPDINTAEALQRIPGISLSTDSGEGRFINIRGLDSDLNATTYAGVRLPPTNPASPFGGGRAVAYDVFPTGIIGGIEVTKTLQPDMDAEGLGGSVNLVPRTGAEYGGKPYLETDLGLGYEPLRSTPVYHAEFSAGRSFSGGDGIAGLFSGADAFSAVITAVYHQDKRGVDDLEEGYSDNQSMGVPDKVLSFLQLRWYQYERQRYGVAGNFDAKANDVTSLYLRVLWSGYLESQQKRYLVFNNLDDSSQGFCTPLPSCIQDPNNPNGYYASQAQLQQQTSDNLERVQNSLAILGGSSVFPSFRLDYHASYVIGTDRFSASPGSVWSDPNPVPMVYDNNTNPHFPTYHTLDGTDPANPAIYQLNNVNLGPSYAKDAEWAAAIDATIPTGSGTRAGEWKFGLSARWRHNTFEATAPMWTPNGVITLTPYTYGAPVFYYLHNYNLGPAINFGQVDNLYGSSGGSITDDAAADASTDTDNNENVYAAYGQYSGRYDKWGWLAGLRVESTHATYRGNLYNGDNDTNAPATQSNSYTNVFPTVQGRYYFSDELVGRLTYASGIARPGFNQITPGAMISITGASVSVGNPALKPTIGQNFDAQLEWYPGHGQIAALGLFYKDFSNYILLTERRVNGYNFPGLQGILTTVDTYSNGPAHAFGAEVQYQQQLLFLPRPWDGFGFNVNATVVDSRAQIHPGVYGLLPSTSQLTWNAAVFYESGPLEVRVAADYVGQNLFSFGGFATTNSTDTYLLARTTLDVGASYAVSHHVSLYLDGRNLLNTPLAYSEGPSWYRPIQREFYDLTLLAGVRATFD